MRFIRFQTLNFSVGVLIKSIFKRVSTHEPSKISSFLPHLSAIGSCCWRVMCYTYVKLTHWTESETSSDRKMEEQPRRQTKRWKKDGGTDGEADRWINRQIEKHTHRRAADWSDLRMDWQRHVGRADERIDIQKNGTERQNDKKTNSSTNAWTDRMTSIQATRGGWMGG